MDPDTRRALETAYRDHAGPVLAYLRSLERDAGAAEDLLQEAFVRVFRGGARAPVPAMRAYLVATARNVWLNERRGRARSDARAARLADRAGTYSRGISGGGTAGGAGYDPVAHAELRELEGLVARALDALPEADAEAFRLRVSLGLEYRAIAEIVGAPEATLRTRAHRAAEAVRAAVGRAYGTGDTSRSP